MENKINIPFHNDSHERTYIVRDEKGNVKSLAPCYAEEEDDLVKAAREYDKKMKTEAEKEKNAKSVSNDIER